MRTAASAVSAFDVALDSVGRFPAGGPPRVMWIGTADRAAGSRVLELGAAVRAGLARQGIAFDAKPLQPHVTLARVRDSASAADAREVGALIARARAPEGAAFRADAVHVMESVLGPKGPRYTSRTSAPLRAGRP